jgi:2-polyprenyl-3-methyl-5-hydroxy-6-metoxy-1,4-benzoquinol methylase
VTEPARDTRSAEYAARLERLSGARWKRWLAVQAPYRWNLRRLALGRTLDLGCGAGRQLAHLPAGSVGIDHNPHAVEAARRRGCEAWLPDEFRASARAGERFDALLAAHVLEHLPRPVARALLADHLGFLRPGARLVLIAPQEAGFRSDPSHVEFLDFAALRALLEAVGCQVLRAYSFPFPRALGHLFRHNEFVVVGRLP